MKENNTIPNTISIFCPRTILILFSYQSTYTNSIFFPRTILEGKTILENKKA